MNKTIDIDRIYSDCKDKIKYTKFQRCNSFKCFVSAESFGRVLPFLVEKCIKDNLSEEDTMSILKIYLLMSGDTQHGALVTHELLPELVRACRSLFRNF